MDTLDNMHNVRRGLEKVKTEEERMLGRSKAAAAADDDADETADDDAADETASRSLPEGSPVASRSRLENHVLGRTWSSPDSPVIRGIRGGLFFGDLSLSLPPPPSFPPTQIGRASCRERV